MGTDENDIRKLVFERGTAERTSSTSITGTVLFLTILNDGHSFGLERTIVDYLEMIQGLFQEGSFHANLGLLISDEEEFNNIKSIIESNTFKFEFAHQIILLHHKTSSRAPAVGEERHSDSVQMERRQLLAVLRNTLLYSALQEEDYVVWIDADIFKIPDTLLPKMISSKRDIITPKCVAGPWFDYDGNAWAGSRSHPTDVQRKAIKDSGLLGDFVPRGGKRINELDPKDGTEFIPLDSVGGTFLFAKAEVYRQGISFPVYYVIGADWDLSQGWDGIETEGLCYVAKTRGYKCWGMPLMDVHHVN